MKHYLKILAIIAILAALFTVTVVALPKETPIKIDYDEEIRICDYEIVFYSNMKTSAHAMAENARALGYSDTHTIIVCAKRDWEYAQERYLAAIEAKDKLIEERDSLWRKRAEEYPVATEIWKFLDEHGINNHVKAGILGNMMAETGGHTLAIRDVIWDNTENYYGICQWSLRYNPQLSGTSLEEQLNHLITSMEYEFDTFGYKYKEGFTYSDFLGMTNEKEAALAFAKSYERCASFSYEKRQKNAEKAYKYFTEG